MRMPRSGISSPEEFLVFHAGKQAVDAVSRGKIKILTSTYKYCTICLYPTKLSNSHHSRSNPGSETAHCIICIVCMSVFYHFCLILGFNCLCIYCIFFAVPVLPLGEIN